MLEKENYPLKELNTFRINAFAKRFIEIFSEEDLVKVCRANVLKEKFFLLGGGSNILIMNDLDLVIKISIPGIEKTSEDDDHIFLTAGAGVVWNDFVNYAVEKNLGGIENMTMIPGTTGAAPVQNIGAYGQELKDTFYSLNAFIIDECQVKSFSKEECKFGYRNSIFKNDLKGKVIITSVNLKLLKNPVPDVSYASVKAIVEKDKIERLTIQDVSRIIASIRGSKLPDPLVLGNAGSFFKNPEIDEVVFEQLKLKFPLIPYFKSAEGRKKIAAGWLIENSGWKGKRDGDVGVHKDQALVLVNYGNATGPQIIEFAGKIKNAVFEKFGIELDKEVNLIS